MLELPESYRRDLMVRMAYHSCAIEGNTFKLGETKSVLIDGIMPGSAHSMRELREIDNYRLFMNAFIEGCRSEREIAPDLVRGFHAVLCRDLLEGGSLGEWKKTRNMIIGAGFETALPEETGALMEKWCARAEDACAGQGGEQDKAAAFASCHLDFERIHPFEDGNGRTGRALLAYQCVKADLPPCVIEADDRDLYISLLNNCDEEGLAALCLAKIRTERGLLQRYRDIERML